MLLAFYAGPRAGELWALRRADYDPLRGALHIRRALHDVGGKLEFGATKNGKERTIILPDFLRAMLADHLAQPLPGGAGPEALIFVGPGGGGGRRDGDGGPVRHALWVRRVFKPAVRKALPHKATFNWHGLRHSCATTLIAAGAHPKLVGVRLGHASITTTMDRYGHVLPNLDDALAATLDATDNETPNNVTPLRAAE